MCPVRMGGVGGVAYRRQTARSRTRELAIDVLVSRLEDALRSRRGAGYDPALQASIAGVLSSVLNPPSDKTSLEPRGTAVT